jgi:hypothetical protein
MSHIRNPIRRAANTLAVGAMVVFFSMSVCAAKNKPERVNLFPRLHTGQVLTYQIGYHSDRRVKTQSPVVAVAPDDSAKVDVNTLLLLEVLSVQARDDRAMIQARVRFQALNSDSNFKVPPIQPPVPQLQRPDPDAKFIDFTILPDGRLDQVTGLDSLLPEQQQAWQEWASRFLMAATFRATAPRVTQKWSSEEAEKAASPIAGLRWVRESTYVRDEPCGAMQLNVQENGNPADTESETCAVILTTAALRQGSKADNTTPEDFKLHQLRTAGTVGGANRIISYISLKSGVLVRATEEANQRMNVTVAKADGSNRVHYEVAAKSHSEVLLISEAPLTNP